MTQHATICVAITVFVVGLIAFTTPVSATSILIDESVLTELKDELHTLRQEVSALNKRIVVLEQMDDSVRRHVPVHATIKNEQALKDSILISELGEDRYNSLAEKKIVVELEEKHKAKSIQDFWRLFSR